GAAGNIALLPIIHTLTNARGSYDDYAPHCSDFNARMWAYIDRAVVSLTQQCSVHHTSHRVSS
ncbi:MAG: hypothetical protein AAFV29_19515, partial [Myxococcota bacterium]